MFRPICFSTFSLNIIAVGGIQKKNGNLFRDIVFFVGIALGMVCGLFCWHFTKLFKKLN